MKDSCKEQINKCKACTKTKGCMLQAVFRDEVKLAKKILELIDEFLYPLEDRAVVRFIEICRKHCIDTIIPIKNSIQEFDGKKDAEELRAAWNYFVFANCQIKPLENIDGVIVAVTISYKGIEYQVRYYIDGEQRTEWFHCFEIVITGKSQGGY